MKELDRRREEFRLQIRRQHIKVEINVRRQLILDSWYARSFYQAIGQLLDKIQPLEKIVAFVMQQFNTCPQSFLGSLANLTALCLCQNDEIGCMALQHPFKFIELLLMIWRYLSDESKQLMARSRFILLLFDRLSSDLQQDYQERGMIFEVACQLSILQAVSTDQKSNKQRQYEISLGDPEQYLRNFSFRRNKLFYQTIVLTLITSPTGLLTKKSRQQLLDVARRIFRQFQSGSCMQSYESFLLIQIGRHCIYEQKDMQILCYLLQSISERYVLLGLRFLDQQVYHESWIDYRMVRCFLKKVSNCISEVWDIKAMLRILNSVMINEFWLSDVVEAIYIDFFKERLHHYVKEPLISQLVNILATFVNLTQRVQQGELYHTIQKCLQLSQQQIEPRRRFKLIQYLLMKNEKAMISMLSYCENDLKLLQQFWLDYKRPCMNNPT